MSCKSDYITPDASCNVRHTVAEFFFIYTVYSIALFDSQCRQTDRRQGETEGKVIG